MVSEPAVPDDPVMMLLRSKFRRNRLTWFNSEDERTLHLDTGDHSSAATYYCAFCSSSATKRSIIFLCREKRDGYGESCWDAWHRLQMIAHLAAGGKAKDGHTIEGRKVTRIDRKTRKLLRQEYGQTRQNSSSAVRPPRALP